MRRSPLAKFTLTTILLMVFARHAAADPLPVEETFHGFARAPEGSFDIANAPAPLFRDPVFNGAADPSVVWHAEERAWYVFYTQRRANAELPPAESWYMGTKIGIARSSDQGRTWSHAGTAQGLSRGIKEETFWAPHVFEDNGMSYTRNSLILDKAGKRADDGYWGSHPGVALAGDRAFIFYHVHAGRRIGCDTPALDQKGIEFKRTSLQVAELELKDGRIVCDRDKYPATHHNP